MTMTPLRMTTTMTPLRTMTTMTPPRTTTTMTPLRTTTTMTPPRTMTTMTPPRTMTTMTPLRMTTTMTPPRTMTTMTPPRMTTVQTMAAPLVKSRPIGTPPCRATRVTLQKGSCTAKRSPLRINKLRLPLTVTMSIHIHNLLTTRIVSERSVRMCPMQIGSSMKPSTRTAKTSAI
jgi:hypothetical protein